MHEFYTTAGFVLIFKTNISTKRAVRALSVLFNAHHAISKWTVDLADVDNVLRIEASQPDCAPVIALVNQAGYHCEELTD